MTRMPVSLVAADVAERAAAERPMLAVDELTVWLRSRGGPVRAVDGISLRVPRNETVAIVGESGSGKSVSMRSIMGLLPADVVHHRSGTVRLGDIDISQPAAARRQCGTTMAIVMQDPTTSLNPVVRVGRQITEVLVIKRGASRRHAAARAVELLAAVGLTEPRRRLDQYPHELSGGMRQRVAIAMALACDPALLIADEPTTALDVTVQAQILDLLAQERRERGMSVILVSHDLGVVASRADAVVVMYAGEVVEYAPAAALFARPSMPYTRALLDAVPRLGAPTHSRLRSIPGRPVNLTAVPEGCRFAARCPYAQEQCRDAAPGLDEVGADHRAACWFPLSAPRSGEAMEVNLRRGATALGMPVDASSFSVTP